MRVWVVTMIIHVRTIWSVLVADAKTEGVNPANSLGWRTESVLSGVRTMQVGVWPNAMESKFVMKDLVSQAVAAMSNAHSGKVAFQSQTAVYPVIVTFARPGPKLTNAFELVVTRVAVPPQIRPVFLNLTATPVIKTKR